MLRNARPARLGSGRLSRTETSRRGRPAEDAWDRGSNEAGSTAHGRLFSAEMIPAMTVFR